MQKIVIGKEHILVDKPIGKGGEGEVYAIAEKPGQAVKIYHPNLRIKREDKIKAMIKEGLAGKSNLIAFPSEIVTDNNGDFLGFIMRLVSGYRPLHELYSPKSRQKFFPKSDYRFIVSTAINVARAIGTVHQTGCVIGDLNHSGILVAQDSTVALIDADSFQFRLNGKSYLCSVGVPDFTPPELQGKNLSTIQRTIEHDNFGLAVAIFQLLFMGKHPYSGIPLGKEDISMSDAIAQNRFAFSLSRQNQTQTKPPPNSLTLDMFPNEIREAFENAFGLDPIKRPNAQKWVEVLTHLAKKSLNHCSKVRTHYYPNLLGICTWCNFRFEMFPSVISVNEHISVNYQNIEQEIREILAFHFPTATTLLPVVSVPKGNSKVLSTAKNKKYRDIFIFLLSIFISGGIAVISIYNSIPNIFAIIAILWLLISISELIGTINSDNINIYGLKTTFEDKDKQVQRELDTFVKANGVSEIIKMYADLKAIISMYRDYDNALAYELNQLHHSRESRQLYTYLDSFSIRDANISGIGPDRTATLLSFGIETAADIDRTSILKIYGFGDVWTGKLLNWRYQLESCFRYDSNRNTQDISDENALCQQFKNEKVKLETAIHNGLIALRNAKSQLSRLPTKAKNNKKLVDALTARAIAEQDLREVAQYLGNSTLLPVSKVSLTMTIPNSSISHLWPKAPRGTSKLQQVVAPVSPKKATTTFTKRTCPCCGSQMKRRSGRYGSFWGCSRYPRCNGSRKI